MGALVSIVIPMYRGAAHIETAVRSALDQTYKNIEVLAIDDGSPDDSGLIVEAIDDSRVKVIRQENQGVAGARNTGIAQAAGSFIAFLDQDDVWHRRKLECQLPHFAQSEVMVVGSFMTYLGPNGPIRAVSGQIADDKRGAIEAARLMPFAPSSMVIRASAIQRVGGFDQKLAVDAGPVDDLDLLSRIAAFGEIRTVGETLGYYRIHAGAETFDKFYEMQRATRFLQARVQSDVSWEVWNAAHVPSRRQIRLDRAKFLYRSAGLNFASSRRFLGLRNILEAACVAPKYVVSRLWRQLR